MATAENNRSIFGIGVRVQVRNHIRGLGGMTGETVARPEWGQYPTYVRLDNAPARAVLHSSHPGNILGFDDIELEAI